MASYLDTQIIIGYAYEGHEHYDDSCRIIEEVRNNGQPYISTFTIVELYSVISRKILEWKLLPSVEDIIPFSAKVELGVKYILQKLAPRIMPDKPNVERLDVANTEAFWKFCEVVQLAPYVTLKALDLLHLAYAIQLKEEGKVDSVASFDGNWTYRKDLIERITGLKVIGREQ